MMAEHWSVLAAREYGDESLAEQIRAEMNAIFADDDDDDEWLDSPSESW